MGEFRVTTKAWARPPRACLSTDQPSCVLSRWRRLGIEGTLDQGSKSQKLKFKMVPILFLILYLLKRHSVPCSRTATLLTPLRGIAAWPTRRCSRSSWSTKSSCGGRTPTSGNSRTTSTTSWWGWWKRRPVFSECPTSRPGRQANSPTVREPPVPCFIIVGGGGVGGKGRKRKKAKDKENIKDFTERDYTSRFHYVLLSIVKNCFTCKCQQD